MAGLLHSKVHVAEFQPFLLHDVHSKGAQKSTVWPSGQFGSRVSQVCPFHSATAGPSTHSNHKHLWRGREPHILHSRPCAGHVDSVTAPPTQAVGNVGVEGIPVELVLKSERQEAMERIKAEYPNLIMIDYTLPQSVNGELYGSPSTGCFGMHQAAQMYPAAHHEWRGP